MRLSRVLLILAIGLLLATVASDRSSSAVAPQVLPNPVLVYIGPEFYTVRGKDFIRYRYQVENFASYPDAMFAAAPNLPPCGLNTSAARTWVDFYDLHGKRLYGFCALGTAADLNKIWFAMPPDEVPPSWVYIELNDRQTNTKYKSNLQESVQ